MNDPCLSVVSPEEPNIEHRVFLRGHSLRFERHRGSEMIGRYELHLPHPDATERVYRVATSKENFTVEPTFAFKGHGSRFFAWVIQFFQKFSNHAGIPVRWEPQSAHPGMRKILERHRFGEPNQKNMDYERLIQPGEIDESKISRKEQAFFDRLSKKILPGPKLFARAISHPSND